MMYNLSELREDWMTSKLRGQTPLPANIWATACSEILLWFFSFFLFLKCANKWKIIGGKVLYFLHRMLSLQHYSKQVSQNTDMFRYRHLPGCWVVLLVIDQGLSALREASSVWPVNKTCMNLYMLELKDFNTRQICNIIHHIGQYILSKLRIFSMHTW